ncbi:MAG: transcription elongation factor GreA [Lachnospiraceae bacterium]|nr:transcription elongation factor GreA [Lachnospiraceae bacterium]
MADKKNILTSQGKKKLEDELNDLKVNRRAEIAQKIKEARAQGDLSENAEYDAAKEEQGEIESRIGQIEEILKNSEVVEDGGDESRVFIGAIVTVFDEEDEEEYDVTIVGANEADSLHNMISHDSPLGAALMGSAIGDVVTVEAPAGSFNYRVINIRRQ